MTGIDVDNVNGRVVVVGPSVGALRASTIWELLVRYCYEMTECDSAKWETLFYLGRPYLNPFGFPMYEKFAHLISKVTIKTDCLCVANRSYVHIEIDFCMLCAIFDVPWARRKFV